MIELSIYSVFFPLLKKKNALWFNGGGGGGGGTGSNLIEKWHTHSVERNQKKKTGRKFTSFLKNLLETT